MPYYADRIQRYQYLPGQLDLEEHYFPGLCVLADEFQEWGRPIGNMQASLIKDCVIDVKNMQNNTTEVEVVYEFDINKNAINDVHYNLFEHILGKAFSLCGMKNIYKKEIDYTFRLKFRSDLRIRYIEVNHDKTFNVKDINIWPNKNGIDAHLNFEWKNNCFFYLVPDRKPPI